MGCAYGKFHNYEKKLGRSEGGGGKNEDCGGGGGLRDVVINPVFRVETQEKSCVTINNIKNNNEINNKKHGGKEKVSKFGGEISSKYEIKGLLGKGTYSSVWRVENCRTKQPYAIKVARMNDRDRNPLDEIVILSRLRHPNIVQFVEVLMTNDETYMVMELATGGDLFDRICSQGPFCERDAIRVLKMVLEGVKYLHMSGIAHRDLKMDNILFYHPGPNSKILITDFALSSRPERPTKGSGHMDTICGTPEYIAPEILAKQLYTCSVDMWAVGVVTYAVLSESFPFNDDTNPKVYRLILSGKYSYKDKVWENVKEGAKNFIDRLLVLDPKSRMSAVQALKHPWIRSRTGDIGGGEHGILHRSISSSSSSGSSSRSSHGESLSSTRRRRRRREMKQHELDQLQNDPEWNLFRQKILVSAGNTTVSS